MNFNLLPIKELVFIYIVYDDVVHHNHYMTLFTVTAGETATSMTAYEEYDSV